MPVLPGVFVGVAAEVRAAVPRRSGAVLASAMRSAVRLEVAALTGSLLRESRRTTGLRLPRTAAE